jgi:glyoxylase-like metal-dependent hydrolase (beta-lactamase superfamily II)
VGEVSDRRKDETPHPPATAEFGSVTPGGPSHVYPAEAGVRIVKVSVGPFDNNVYVIASGGEAVIVDGAADADRILQEAAGLTVRAIVQTHGHPDHVAALASLVDRLGAPVMAHPGDGLPVPFRPLRDGDRVSVGPVEVRVLHTPGHTPGSLCYLVANHLFSGDTLFPGGPGNTDGDQGRFTQIMASLDRLFELADETRVSPGHGLDTTIGRERPYLETWRARGW